MTESKPIPIAGLAHIGIRVHDLARSVRFYEVLGFTKTAGPVGPEPDVLMDVPEKHPGITHIALLCADLREAETRLAAAGFPLSGGLVRFSPTAQGIFVRDPDGNVIELHQRG